MPPFENGPNITDWIIAISGIFAAIGTVGAVIVALRQIRRQERRRLHVECRLAITEPTPGNYLNVVALRGTNEGQRPIKVTQAYMQTDDSRMIFAHFTPWSDSLPKLLLDGESVEVGWEADKLEKAKADEGFKHYLYGFFTDTVGRVYPGAYPGVKVRRRGLPWKRHVEWEPPDE